MLFFAYDSLVNRDQLAEVCPQATPLQVARILDHKLCFTGRSERWEGGTATIGLGPGCQLWGGLYEVHKSERAHIEEHGRRSGYVWAFTPVLSADGAVQTGLLVKVRDLERSAPSRDYLEILQAGWVQWGLDPEEVLRHVALS